MEALHLLEPLPCSLHLATLQSRKETANMIIDDVNATLGIPGRGVGQRTGYYLEHRKVGVDGPAIGYQELHGPNSGIS